MLELYHHGSSVCAAKVRFALALKGVEIDQWHYIDVLKGDQFDPDFMKINPKAVVPALVHDDKVIKESTVICEYIGKVFAGTELVPADPYGKTQMRLWTKIVDEELHPACGELTFACCHRHIVARLGEQKIREFMRSTPDLSVTSKWKERKKEIIQAGLDVPGIDATIRLYDGFLFKMEEME